jgi:hypothetical protein
MTLPVELRDIIYEHDLSIPGHLRKHHRPITFRRSKAHKTRSASLQTYISLSLTSRANARETHEYFNAHTNFSFSLDAIHSQMRKISAPR